ncbi:MAG: hypothetical protein ABR571_12015 [Jatrophihabitans sp.]|uniref:hypothetical protein n=1 Tax=Jatrophihabitans sp. TaxID=1932789 RepID=UPI00390F5781
MFSLAIEDSAASVNPVRDSSARISWAKRSPRALTTNETHELVTLLRGSERACSLDLPDLVDWMLATGSRIGEAMALRWGVNSEGKPLLDLDAGTWEVTATIVRAPRRGLLAQLRPKTEAGWRVVAVPGFAIEMLRHRPTSGFLFLAPFGGGLRDPNNVSGDLRQLLDSLECSECRGTGFQRSLTARS